MLLSCLSTALTPLLEALVQVTGTVILWEALTLLLEERMIFPFGTDAPPLGVAGVF